MHLLYFQSMNGLPSKLCRGLLLLYCIPVLSLMLNVLLPVSLAAQSQTQPVKPQQVIPPSPDAASLGKYGSIPVGLHTGVPNIDIPIYTIKEGSLELPISISYHASGVKVNEIASWVGLGWTLNAGGAVSRSVVGKSDEHGFFETTVKKASQITLSDFEFLKPFADGSGDYESDYYFYNFSGHAGKFIYKQNNFTTPFLIPKEPIVVSRISGGFQIIDERGVTYLFDQPETTVIPGEPIQEFTSSYYLTRIISSDGKDVINFSYFYDTGYYDGNTTYIVTIGQTCSSPGTPSNDYYSPNTIPGGRTIYPVRLSEISFSSGKVKFIPDVTRSDLSGSRLAEVQIFARKSDGNFETTPRKTIALGEGYFGSGMYSRLKLTDLQEKDAQNTGVRKHTFQYIESPALPPRGSLAEDWWGFYNGQTSNTSLIATQIVGFAGFPFSVGGAIREPDSTSMKAGTLNKITYPTGGYTEFSYEPHFYSGVMDSMVTIAARAGAMGNTTTLMQETKSFTPPNSGWAKLHTYCSDVQDAEPFFSRVILKKQNETVPLVEHYYTPYQFPDYPPHLIKDFWVYLQGGSTYDLTVMSQGHSTSSQFNGAAFSQADLYYQKQITSTKIMAGGLRVSKIRDFESATAAPIIKTFKYGTAAAPGSGILLVPQYGVSNAKQEVEIHWFEAACGGSVPYSCCNVPSCYAARMTISGTAALDLTALNGSPVVYSEVTVYENSVATPNGRSVHKFDAQVDEFGYADKAYNNGRWQTNNSWKGGDEIWNASYVGNTNNSVSENTSGYSIYSPEETIGTKVGWKIQTEGCSPNLQTPENLFSRLYYFDVSFLTGIKKITLTNAKTLSSSDPSKFVETQTTYEYDNLSQNHQQVSRKTTTSSEGDTYKSNYWYPADYSTSLENMQALIGSNILVNPVKEETHKNGILISGTVTRMDDDGRPLEIYSYESSPVTAPAHNPAVLIPAGYVKKLDLIYDGATKNLVATQPKDNLKTAYLWGYNNRLPIAEIVNADTARAVHTSFEENGTINADAKTGARVWSGVFAMPLPDYNGVYQLSYWKKTGSNPWVLVEQQVTVTSSAQTENIGAIGSVIDEVRVMPIGARITTYTYDPIAGMTSSTDANQNTTYFDYDDFGRLKYVKDSEKNVVRSYSYNYKQH